MSPQEQMAIKNLPIRLENRNIMVLYNLFGTEKPQTHKTPL